MSADSRIETRQDAAVQQNDASATLSRDLYQWSPEGPIGNCGTQQGSCNRGQTGDRPAGNTGGSPARSSDCDWRPDPTLSTPRARQWQAESQKQRQLPLDLNPDCTYTVEFGDSLWTIAERDLRGRGMSTDVRSINERIKVIADANDEKYRSLDCNTQLIKTGWKLYIPDCPAAPPPVQERPCPPPVQERPCPPPVVEAPAPPVQERPCPPPVQERPCPPPADFRPPEWFRPEAPCPPMVYEPPCYPNIVVRPAQMHVIRIPEPVCYPVQIPQNCCCPCRPPAPMYGPPPRVYYPQPPVYYPQPHPGYEVYPPSASWRRPPEPGYRDRLYPDYPHVPLIPSNDWVHRYRQ